MDMSRWRLRLHRQKCRAFGKDVSPRGADSRLQMRFRTLGFLVILACGLGLFCTPLVATAQQPGKAYRIGFLSAYSPPPPSAPTPLLDAFWQQLRELGGCPRINMCSLLIAS